VHARAATLARKVEARSSALAASIHEVRAVAEQHRPGHGLTGADLRAAWMRFRGRMVPAYMALAQGLRAERVHVPPLRPTNHSRTAFHVASASASCWRSRSCSPPGERGGVLHLRRDLLVPRDQPHGEPPRERPPDGGSLLPARHPPARAPAGELGDLVRDRDVRPVHHEPAFASAAAIAVLGVGDQFAALIGRRWGRTTLLYGRTLEGSIAFVLSATVAAFAVLVGFHPLGSWPVLLAIAAGGATAGAVAELVSKRLDDNFTIPLSAAAGAALVAHVLGVA